MDTQSPPSTPMMGCLVRLFWMFVGNMALLFCLVFILRGPARALGVYDGVYAGLLLALVLARWVEIRCYAGETAEDGTPATLADWRCYTAVVVSIAAAAWLAVRAFLWLRHPGT